MNNQSSQAPKSMLNLVESEVQLPEIKGYSTINYLNQLNSQNNEQKVEKRYESMVQLAKSPKRKRDEAQKVDKKPSLVKRTKQVNIQFSQFLPELFVLINQQKIKAVIRVGKNFQANVPSTCKFSYLYRPLGHLKLWEAGEIQFSIFKKFREKFGENRSEQDLCMLLYQYQCDWGELNDHINEFKGELRKWYLQKDRTKL